MFNRTVLASAVLLAASPSFAYDFSFKGMIKPEFINTSAAVGSYGNTYSQVAPTHALRTDIFAGGPATAQQTEYLDSPAGSFQIAHSRFSLNMKHEKVRTIFEFDFIDGDDGFTNQTAIQAQGARLRLATIYYDASENLTYFAGQKWSTAAGIKSNGSYNWIGNGYRAGNSGFLALEAGATYKADDWTITGAVTGRGRNNSATGINANELGGMPGLALDVNYAYSGHKIGFAGHVSKVRFENEAGFTSGQDQDANLFKVYGSWKFDGFKLDAEFYTGESLNNQNALGIAPSTRLDGAGAVREGFGESGYFAYVTWSPAAGHTMKFGHSNASVDSSDQDRLSLTELADNSTTYINYGVELDESLVAFAQLTDFTTQYGGDFAEFSSLETRVGVVFKF
ncbi:MAG: hypothetical protein V2I33_04400 [Kangiellaceae bacterium]|jgi:hypothetical protein|nr:hypothetical protein [Kangiellaceae bacterium]